MRGKRGTAGQRAHALPMQEPGQERLAARMLLVQLGSRRPPSEAPESAVLVGDR
jgi:hypothetical protein